MSIKSRSTSFLYSEQPAVSASLPGGRPGGVVAAWRQAQAATNENVMASSLRHSSGRGSSSSFTITTILPLTLLSYTSEYSEPTAGGCQRSQGEVCSLSW